MLIIVYHGTVWVFIGPPFTAEVILDPMHIDSLVDTLTQASKQARGDKKL
jgi:hypothetical protein